MAESGGATNVRSSRGHDLNAAGLAQEAEDEAEDDGEGADEADLQPHIPHLVQDDDGAERRHGADERAYHVVNEPDASARVVVHARPLGLLDAIAAAPASLGVGVN